MSNPWKRLDGDEGHLRYSDMGDQEEMDVHCVAYLRIRHGARAACKRLRRERDEARGHYRWMVEHAADQKLDGYRELGARAAAAENERDAARLELRALEWLLHQQPGRFNLVCSINLAGRIEIPLRGALEHSESYASAARALGWEG